MDSLTQFALGATVSALCLGKSIGPRKAAILGGVLGTLPDLDVFLPFDSPVDSFVLHRGWSHAFAIHALATPVVGEIILRLFSSLRERRALVWLTVFLCFTTHAIIDGITVYGTRLFLPFYPDPVGVGSMFIIDPIYTLPLLIVVVWSLFNSAWSQRLGRAIKAALIFTTAYMGLSIALQAQAATRAKTIFAETGIATDRVFAIAAPLNIVVWKVIALEDDRYHNLYLSLFDGAHVPPIHSHPRRPDLIACLDGIDGFEKLEWFSRGYYRADLVGDRIVVSDLRMGLTPNYAFQFAVAERAEGSTREIPPERARGEQRTAEGDFAWLGQRLLGRPAVRPVEKENPSISTAAIDGC